MQAAEFLSDPKKRVTPEQVKEAVLACGLLSEVIRDLGEVPAGKLYVRVMNHMTLGTFDSFIDRLVGAGLVRRDPSHLLVWVGPKFAEEVK